MNPKRMLSAALAAVVMSSTVLGSFSPLGQLTAYAEEADNVSEQLTLEQTELQSESAAAGYDYSYEKTAHYLLVSEAEDRESGLYAATNVDLDIPGITRNETTFGELSEMYTSVSVSDFVADSTSAEGLTTDDFEIYIFMMYGDSWTWVQTDTPEMVFANYDGIADTEVVKGIGYVLRLKDDALAASGLKAGDTLQVNVDGSTSWDPNFEYDESTGMLYWDNACSWDEIDTTMQQYTVYGNDVWLSWAGGFDFFDDTRASINLPRELAEANYPNNGLTGDIVITVTSSDTDLIATESYTYSYDGCDISELISAPDADSVYNTETHLFWTAVDGAVGYITEYENDGVTERALCLESNFTFKEGMDTAVDREYRIMAIDLNGDVSEATVYNYVAPVYDEWDLNLAYNEETGVLSWDAYESADYEGDVYYAVYVDNVLLTSRVETEINLPIALASKQVLSYEEIKGDIEISVKAKDELNGGNTVALGNGTHSMSYDGCDVSELTTTPANVVYNAEDHSVTWGECENSIGYIYGVFDEIGMFTTGSGLITFDTGSYSVIQRGDWEYNYYKIWSVDINGDASEPYVVAIDELFGEVSAEPADWTSNISYDSETGLLSWDAYTGSDEEYLWYHINVNDGDGEELLNNILGTEIELPCILASKHIGGYDYNEGDLVFTVQVRSYADPNVVYAESTDSVTYNYDGCEVNEALSAPADVVLAANGVIEWIAPEGVYGYVIKVDAGANLFSQIGTAATDRGLANSIKRDYSLDDVDVTIYSVDINGDIGGAFTSKLSEISAKAYDAWDSDLSYDASTGILSWTEYDGAEFCCYDIVIEFEGGSYNSRFNAGNNHVYFPVELARYKHFNPSMPTTLTLHLEASNYATGAVYAVASDSITIEFNGGNTNADLAAPSDAYLAGDGLMLWTGPEDAVGYMVSYSYPDGSMLSTLITPGNDDVYVVKNFIAYNGLEDALVTIRAVDVNGDISASYTVNYSELSVNDYDTWNACYYYNALTGEFSWDEYSSDEIDGEIWYQIYVNGENYGILERNRNLLCDLAIESLSRQIDLKGELTISLAAVDANDFTVVYAKSSNDFVFNYEGGDTNESLAAPSGVKRDSAGNVSWDAVENAIGYFSLTEMLDDTGFKYWDNIGNVTSYKIGPSSIATSDADLTIYAVDANGDISEPFKAKYSELPEDKLPTWTANFEYDPETGALSWDAYSSDEIDGNIVSVVCFNGRKVQSLESGFILPNFVAMECLKGNEYTSDIEVTLLAANYNNEGIIYAESSDSFTFSFDGCDVNDSLAAPKDFYVENDAIYWTASPDALGYICETAFIGGTWPPLWNNFGKTNTEWGMTKMWMEYAEAEDAIFTIYAVDLNGDVSEAASVTYSELPARQVPTWNAEFWYLPDEGRLGWTEYSSDEVSKDDVKYLIYFNNRSTNHYWEGRYLENLPGMIVIQSLKGNVYTDYIEVSIAAVNKDNESIVYAKSASPFTLTYDGFGTNEELAVPTGFERDNDGIITWNNDENTYGYVIVTEIEIDNEEISTSYDSYRTNTTDYGNTKIYMDWLGAEDADLTIYPIDVNGDVGTPCEIKYSEIPEALLDTWDSELSYNASTGVLSWTEYDGMENLCYDVVVSYEGGSFRDYYHAGNKHDYFPVTLAHRKLFNPSIPTTLTLRLEASSYMTGEVYARATDSITIEFNGGGTNTRLAKPSASVKKNGEVYWDDTKDAVGYLFFYGDIEGELRHASLTGTVANGYRDGDLWLVKNFMEENGFDDALIEIYAVNAKGEVSAPFISKYSELPEYQFPKWSSALRYNANTGALTWKMHPDDLGDYEVSYRIVVNGEEAVNSQYGTICNYFPAVLALEEIYKDRDLSGKVTVSLEACAGFGNEVFAVSAETITVNYDGCDVNNKLAVPSGAYVSDATDFTNGNLYWDEMPSDAVGYITMIEYEGDNAFVGVSAGGNIGMGYQTDWGSVSYNINNGYATDAVVNIYNVDVNGDVSVPLTVRYSELGNFNAAPYFNTADGRLYWNEAGYADHYIIRVSDGDKVMEDVCYGNNSSNYDTLMGAEGFSAGRYIIYIYAVDANGNEILIGNIAYDFDGGKYSDGDNTFYYTKNSDGTVTIIGADITTPELEIPAKLNGRQVSEIGTQAFAAAGIITSVVIPEGVKKLSWYAFNLCENLESVQLPKTLEYIDSWAFERCYSLKTINIPAATTTVMGGAFAQNTSMTSITCDANNTNYVSVDGVLYTKDMSALVAYPGGRGGRFQLPSTVHHIGDAAFYGADGLTAVEIVGDIDFIGFEAFAECANLSNVRINEGVTYVGYWAFRGCDNIAQLTVPQSVTNIGNEAFGFADYEGNKQDGFTLRGYKDSAIYFYALRHDIPFICIGEAESSPFEDENSVESEVEADPEKAEEEQITSIILNSPFTMKDKSEAGVGIDMTDVKVKASEIYDDEEAIAKVEEALGTDISANKKYNLLDLTLVNGDIDISQQYDGLVEVLIKIPGGHQDKDFYCYRIIENDDGTVSKELIPGVRKSDEYYAIYLEHFSLYAFVSDEEHTCEFSANWSNDAEKHWHECSCGAIADDAEHIESDWIVEVEATDTQAGYKYKDCTVCGYLLAEQSLPATGDYIVYATLSDGRQTAAAFDDLASALATIKDSGGTYEIVMNKVANVSALTIPKTAKSITFTGYDLVFTGKTLNVPVDTVFDCNFAAYNGSVKTTAKSITFNGVTELKEITGVKTTTLTATRTFTVTNIKTFGKLNGRFHVNGSATGITELNDSDLFMLTVKGKADIALVTGESRIGMYSDGTMAKVTVTDIADGASLSVDVNNCTPLASGTTVLYTKGKDLTDKITIGSYSTDGNTLTAFYYAKTKSIKAEWAGAVTLSYGDVEKELPNLDLAFEEITKNKDNTADYTITLNEAVTTGTLNIPKSAKSITFGGEALNFTGKTLTIPVDMTFQSDVNAETATIKITAKNVVFEKYLTAKDISGAKITQLHVERGADVQNIKTFGKITGIYNVNGSVSGVTEMGDGVLAMTLANGKADIVNITGNATIAYSTGDVLPKVTVTDIADGAALTINVNSGEALASGATVLYTKGKDLSSKVAIANKTAGGNTLTAFYYAKTKSVKAEWADAITLSYGDVEKNLPNIDKVFEEITANKDNTANYIITLNEALTVSALNIPKTLNGIGFYGESLTFTGKTLNLPVYTYFKSELIAEDAAVKVSDKIILFDATIKDITGAKNSRAFIYGDTTVQNIKTFVEIDLNNDGHLTVTKSMSGVEYFNGKLTLGADATADIKYPFEADVELIADSTGKFGKLSITDVYGIGSVEVETGEIEYYYADINVTVLNEDGNEAALASGTPVLTSKNDILDCVTIANTTTGDEEGYPLTAVYNAKTKTVYAEYESAVALVCNADAPEYFSSLESAFAEITRRNDSTAEYIITLNCDICTQSFALPKAAEFITINGAGHTVNMTNVATVTAAIPVRFMDITLDSTKAFKLTTTADLFLDDLDSSTLTAVTGKETSFLYWNKANEVSYGITGFGRLTLNADLATSAALTVNDLYANGGALIVKDASVVKLKNVTVANALTICYDNATKAPVNITGIVTGDITIADADGFTAGQQVLTAPKVTPDQLTIDEDSLPDEREWIFTANKGKVVIDPVAFVVDCDDTVSKFVSWSDLAAYINTQNDADAVYTVALTGDHNIGAALAMPRAGKFSKLIVSGFGDENNYILSFTGAVKLTGDTTFEDITLKAADKKGNEAAYTITLGAYTLTGDNVDFGKCTAIKGSRGSYALLTDCVFDGTITGAATSM